MVLKICFHGDRYFCAKCQRLYIFDMIGNFVLNISICTYMYLPFFKLGFEMICIWLYLEHHLFPWKGCKHLKNLVKFCRSSEFKSSLCIKIYVLYLVVHTVVTISWRQNQLCTRVTCPFVIIKRCKLYTI